MRNIIAQIVKQISTRKICLRRWMHSRRGCINNLKGQEQQSALSNMLCGSQASALKLSRAYQIDTQFYPQSNSLKFLIKWFPNMVSEYQVMRGPRFKKTHHCQVQNYIYWPTCYALQRSKLDAFQSPKSVSEGECQVSTTEYTSVGHNPTA